MQHVTTRLPGDVWEEFCQKSTRRGVKPRTLIRSLVMAYVQDEQGNDRLDEIEAAISATLARHETRLRSVERAQQTQFAVQWAVLELLVHEAESDPVKAEARIEELRVQIARDLGRQNAAGLAGS